MAGIDARYLHGGTATLERRELLEDFREGLFPVLVNCAILTEGADVPSIDCVLLARPTRSRNIFSQMIGRGLRLSPKTGKKECLILDVVGSIEKGVVCVPTLFGLDVNEDIEGEDIGSLRQRGLDLNPSILEEDPGLNSGPSSSELADPTNVTYIDYDNPWELHKAMVRGNTGIVERMSRNAWVDCGGDVYVLDIPTAGFIRVERNEDEPEEKEEKDEENGELVLTSFYPIYSPCSLNLDLPHIPLLLFSRLDFSLHPKEFRSGRNSSQILAIHSSRCFPLSKSQARSLRIQC